jgi:hypothetical protein
VWLWLLKNVHNYKKARSRAHSKHTLFSTKGLALFFIAVRGDAVVVVVVVVAVLGALAVVLDLAMH